MIGLGRGAHPPVSPRKGAQAMTRVLSDRVCKACLLTLTNGRVRGPLPWPPLERFLCWSVILAVPLTGSKIHVGPKERSNFEDVAFLEFRVSDQRDPRAYVESGVWEPHPASFAQPAAVPPNLRMEMQR